MRVGVDGGPRGFDEHAAQVAAALLGDVAIAVGLARSVDAGTEAGISHQFLGVGKTGNIANGCQDGQRRKQREAGELDEVGQLRFPGRGHTEPPQLSRQIRELVPQMLQGGDIVAGAQALGG